MTFDLPLEDASEKATVEDQAMAWVVRLTSGETTSEDHDHFRLWRDASALHAEALARARRLWMQMEIALPEIEQEHAAERDRQNLEHSHERQRLRFARRFAPQLAIAASLLVAINLGFQYVHNWQFDQVTGVGERRTIVMADGTSIAMNADTAFNENFTKGERRIRMVRGQAFFQIAHEVRPFIVETRHATIRDIGTDFNVALTPLTTRVVVREGLVEASNDRQRVRLGAGQGTDITATGIAAAEVVDMSLETAWMRGRFVAADMPLSDVIAAIAPYSSRRIVLRTDAVASKRVNASIDLNNVGEWLASLDQMDDIDVTTLPGLIIIS
jgi:transmembrane sensor